ncbi:NUDIX hydrolase [Streptomyces sp. NPDC088400]|uniref:NUDIX hydrolase n=1 Tax=Streptomyces sp. NPDC088400 TaxID=3365861 RepID=UPI00380CBCA1
MEVVDVWTGHRACKLQAALRMTNESFADRLGISSRTVATWHSAPDVVPRSEMQQLLDSLYEDAPTAVRQRFAMMTAEAGRESAAVSVPLPQALRVAIAVVVHDDNVLLVCRRDDESGITWQFPAGVIKPGVRPESTVVRETLDETGVHCGVRRGLGERLHPVTWVQCVYFLCQYLAGEAVNKDIVENVDVTWAPKSAVARFITTEKIYPPILAALEEDV